MDIDIRGIDLTTPKSFATVVICYAPKGFLISFPQNKKLFAQIVNLPGALFGDDSPYKGMIFVPRDQFNSLKDILQNNAKWRSKEDLERDQNFLREDQETLQDVLNRLDSNLDVSYMKLEPYSFQKLAVSWATNKKGKQEVVGGLLADQMGLGKTIEGIATACYLKRQGMIKNCLIIAPATLKLQWEQEIEKFSNEDSIIIKTKKTNNKTPFETRQELYEQIRNDQPFFTIINYEMLYQREVKDTITLKKKTDSGKNKTQKVYGDYLDLNEILRIGYDMVIIDEAHKMKNPDTLIAKSIRQIDANYKLLMTGTPIEKELKNLFQLFDYINPRILLNQPINDFEKRRAIFEEQHLIRRLNPFSYPRREIEYLGEKNTDVLRQKINPFMLRRRTEDVSDEMPGQVDQKITVDFADYQAKLYNKITDEMRSQQEQMKQAKDEETYDAIENQFKGLSQMRTIVCDSPSILLKSDSALAKRIVGKRKSFPTVPKVDRLLELIQEICLDNDQKVVIFTRFARVAHYLSEEIGKFFKKRAKEMNAEPYRHFVYEGDTKEGCKLRDELEKQGKDKAKAQCFGCPFYNECETRTKYAWHFQNDDQTKVLIATDAANVGVNLQTGNHLINYDLPDSFSVYLQRNGRIRRLGSEHDQVFIYDMVTKDGVDEKKLDSIKQQIKMNEKVIENDQDDKKAIKEADETLQNIINEIE